MIANLTRLALVLGLGITPLAAQPGGTPGHPGRASAIVRLSQKLNLTETQKLQLQAIQTRHAETTKEKAQASAEAHKAFHAAIQNPETPAAQLKTLYQAKSDKTLELMLERRSMQSEIRTLLTPDQRMEWEKLQAYRQGVKQGQRSHHKGARS